MRGCGRWSVGGRLPIKPRLWLPSTQVEGGVFYLISSSHADITGCTISNTTASSFSSQVSLLYRVWLGMGGGLR